MSTPEWINDSDESTPTTQREFYGYTRNDGKPDSDREYVEIIRDQVRGVFVRHQPTDRPFCSRHWCYSIHGLTSWIELPPHVETLEEAKAVAMALWRMS